MGTADETAYEDRSCRSSHLDRFISSASGMVLVVADDGAATGGYSRERDHSVTLGTRKSEGAGVGAADDATGHTESVIRSHADGSVVTGRTLVTGKDTTDNYVAIIGEASSAAAAATEEIARYYKSVAHTIEAKGRYIVTDGGSEKSASERSRISGRSSVGTGYTYAAEYYSPRTTLVDDVVLTSRSFGTRSKDHRSPGSLYITETV